jgi:DNA polymerase-3 subunit gamma/tau
MSEVLYRKYRPKKFEDVIGQDHVVKVLEAQVKSGDIAHAYVFAGTRGTGKTSVARILASEIGITSNDIYEIDAASHTGVDDIREINDSVYSLPFDSKYKVYILDEAHMLSKQASNALLKTLEEPPAHVIFILATTEIHKIPETVLSRCQVYTFKKPTQEVLKKVVQNICKKEGFKIDDPSAELVSLLGDGSFRDTLGIVQKIVSFSKDKNISEEEVRLVTGAGSVELINGVVEAISKDDLSMALSKTKEVVMQNLDISVFIKLLLHMVRAVMLLSFGEEGMVKGELNQNQFDFAKEMSKPKDKFTSGVLVELLTAYENTKGAYIPSLPLEIALINIIKKS